MGSTTIVRLPPDLSIEDYRLALLREAYVRGTIELAALEREIEMTLRGEAPTLRNLPLPDPSHVSWR